MVLLMTLFFATLAARIYTGIWVLYWMDVEFGRTYPSMVRLVSICISTNAGSKSCPSDEIVKVPIGKLERGLLNIIGENDRKKLYIQYAA